MLLSPGHSPRHLSTPSPSSTISATASAPVKRAKRNNVDDVTVLDEDAYVASIEKIVERDFFPDLPKLRDRLDWLEAVRTGDPLRIRDAQLKIMERRGLKVATCRPGNETVESRGNFTPGSTFVRKFDFDKTPGVVVVDNVSGGGDEFGHGGDLKSVDVNLRLDEFLKRYKGEDDESFSKIMERTNRKRKERYSYLYASEKDGVEAVEGAKRNADGYGTSGQPASTLEGWKYTAKNLLMYHPADRGEVALTEEEKAVRIKGLTKEINLGNTRFCGKLMESEGRGEVEVPVVYAQNGGGTPVPMSGRDLEKLRNYDLDDLRKTPNPHYVESDKKSENGYRFVKTPSPAPGVEESPFITWGEIEGTPLRLEPEETPIEIGGSADGPHFKIPLPSSRDVLAHNLSREATRKIRERSKLFNRPPLPSSSRAGSASPSVGLLSPAAKRLMKSSNFQSSSSVDESLRASYGGSPASVTPKTGRSISRLGRSMASVSRSPSVVQGADQAW